MKGIGAKILKIYEELKAVGKDMKIQVRGGSYEVRSEEAVLNAIRPLLIKNGLVMMQTEAHGEKTGSITRVNTKYMLIDTETGEFITLAGYGEGSDTQDKGAGMAQTYALKNTLLKSFMLVSGEDADNVSSDSKDENQKNVFDKACSETKSLLEKALNAGKITEKQRNMYLHRYDKLEPQKDVDAMRALYAEILKEVKSTEESPQLDG